MTATTEAPTTWSTREAAELAGVSARQLDYWANYGLFGMELVTPGTGRPRTWTAADLQGAWVAGQVSRAVAAAAGYRHTVGGGAGHEVLAAAVEAGRAGTRWWTVELVPGVELTVDLVAPSFGEVGL